MIRSLGTCMLALAASSAGASDVVQLSAEQRARAGIEVSAVTHEDFGSRLRAVGMVVRSPGSTLVLKTIAGGRVETLEVAPGERVRARPAGGDPPLPRDADDAERAAADVRPGQAGRTASRGRP